MQLAKIQDTEIETFWQAVVERDASMDGRFFFAVESTACFADLHVLRDVRRSKM